MKLDVKKTHPTPKDRFEAIELLNKANDNLVDALFIMDSIIKHDDNYSISFQKKKIKQFIKRFEL